MPSMSHLTMPLLRYCIARVGVGHRRGLGVRFPLRPLPAEADIVRGKHFVHLLGKAPGIRNYTSTLSSEEMAALKLRSLAIALVRWRDRINSETPRDKHYERRRLIRETSTQPQPPERIFSHDAAPRRRDSRR